MKNLYLILFISSLSLNLYSQNLFTSFAGIDTKDSATIVEKVYLHTDRSSFIAGESIWFKAYLVDASTNMLINHSKNLYVELISPDSKISQKRTIQIDDGIGYGDFLLSDSTKSGRYLIRAYTNWMRNFGDLFFFEKEISVANSTDVDHLLQKKFTIQTGIDIQFFPEGGALVDSIPTKLAFKAVDTSGIGCNIKGIIRSSKGQNIGSFESTHLGMGAFNILPIANETYTVSGVTENGKEFSVELPKPLKSGFNLEVKNQNEKEVNLVIKTNRKTQQQFFNKTLKLRVSSHNEEYLNYDIKISALANRFTLPTTDLPEGISSVTLISTDGTPLCERLVYIRKTQEYKISISSSGTAYAPRSEVKLNVTVKDTLGTNELATLSLSAVDANIFNSSTAYSGNIASYLLLQSEVKGNIEQPGYYFDPRNEDRWSKLDLLLLTQGWRDFIWKYMPEKTVPNYPLENGFVVSGKLRRAILNIPIDKANITLTLLNDSSKYFLLTRTDSLGRFRFDSLFFNGKLKIILSAKADNKRLQEMISIDSATHNAPDLDYEYTSKYENLLSAITQLRNESIYQRMIKKKYQLSDTIVLDEVVIKKYIRKNQANDNHVRIYNQADNVIKVTESDGGRSDIFSLIQSRVNGVTVSTTYKSGFKEYIVQIGGNKVINVGQTKNLSPLYLLDGIPTTAEALTNIPVFLIDKIEIIKRNASAFGIQGLNGVISVFTKNGDRGQYTPLTNSIKRNITGYDSPMVFYAPKYNITNNEADKPDLRNTIYWDPNIVTENENGETISFFNADRETTVEVRVEGITRAGIPVTGYYKYEVKGKKANSTSMK